MAKAGLSSHARGYGKDHRAERKRWEPIVATGEVLCYAEICLMDSRIIEPFDEWDLGHTPDRLSWTGPEHRRCNRSEGARRGNAMRTKEFPSSRDW